MKRDPDLVRHLLLFLEEKSDDKGVDNLVMDGYSESEVMYHFILMDQAGLLRCERIVSRTTPDRVIRVLPFSLTWQGHEFLEASRDEGAWKKAKELVKSKSGALSFDVLKGVLIGLAKDSVGL